MEDKFKSLYIKNSRLPKRYAEDISLVPTTQGDLESFGYLNKVKENIVKFVKLHKNLLISSNEVGNGKTSWAAKILLYYINEHAYLYAYDRDTPVLFINVPEFLMKKKLSINDSTLTEEINSIEKCIFSANIVVFDDIATKTASDYDKELLYTYINYRTDNLLTNIYTTNISIYNLPNELGDRLADRIIGYSKCVELNGSGMRGNNK